jgi:hypothetical protein
LRAAAAAEAFADMRERDQWRGDGHGVELSHRQEATKPTVARVTGQTRKANRRWYWFCLVRLSQFTTVDNRRAKWVWPICGLSSSDSWLYIVVSTNKNRITDYDLPIPKIGAARSRRP